MTRSRSRSRDRDRRRTRSRSRDKRRSRSPDRGRDRSPDRGRDRSRGSNWDAQGGSSADVVAMQAMLAMQQQQAMQRQLMAQQQALAAAAVMATQVPSGDLALDALPTQTNKKQRELYIGNLAVGIVTPEMLRELFNSMLSAMVPDPITQPPVLDVRGDPSGTGRFAFVEFRTAGLAIAALQLDKVELAGRAINIGRPKGYIEPPSLNQQAKLSAAVQFAAQMSGGPTNVVLLENLMPAALMRDEEEKRELYDDIFMEASKCGTVIGMAVPVPPPGVPDSESARVFIKFTTQEASTKCKAMMDGREFDDRKVKASYSSDDAYYRSQANEWVSTAPVPGAYVPTQNLPSMALPTGFS